MPNATGDAIRAAKNEVLLRDLNERLEAHHRLVGRRFPEWVCECADETCAEPVEMSVEEYEAVRAEATRFLVVPSIEHVEPRIERVVQREDRYWVVEKIGIGEEISEALDPRST